MVDHERLITWVTEAEDSTQASSDQSEKCRDYYDSRQLEDKEIRALKRRGQAPVVVNRIKPKIDALMGMERAAKTTAKAFPRTPIHEDAAEAATEGVRFVLKDNDFDQLRSAVWENILIEGTGGGEVLVEFKGDEARIRLKHLMWDRLVYDPHSRRKDFSDARYLGQVVWMDYDEALDKYPDAKDVLEDMLAGTQKYDDKPRWMDTTRRRVKIVELYYRDKGEVYYSCFTRGGYVKSPQISPYKNEEGETEWPYEFASSFVSREGDRYGAILQLLDVQDEINKRRSKALHLMSVRQVRWEKGAVEDINKTRQELAKPDGVIETTPGMEFEVLKTGDMAQAQFNLLAEAKMEIDLVGANAATQGKDKTVSSGVALERRQQAGQTEIGPMFDVLRYWQYRIFKKVWNRIRQYWKEEKWIRVTDDENNLRWVGLNKPITKGEQMLKQAKEQGAPPEILQQLQQRMAMDPMMKEQVGTENDIAELDVDIILQEVPDALTQQIEDFQVLGEMVKSGFPMPPQAVIEASPLSNKDKILKLMKEQPQLPPELQKQMEQMQEQMKALTEENQTLKSDTQMDQQKLQAKAAESQAELQLKAQIQAAELQMLREKTEAEIALKRMVAEADYEIESRKIAMQQECETQKLAFEKEKGATPGPDQDTELKKAALAGAVQIEVARIKAVDPEQKQKEKKEADGDAMMKKLMQTQEKLLAGITANKKVSVKRTGTGLEGTVTVQ